MIPQSERTISRRLFTVKLIQSIVSPVFAPSLFACLSFNSPEKQTNFPSLHHVTTSTQGLFVKN